MKLPRITNRGAHGAAAALLVALAAAIGGAPPANAQGFSWPWSDPEPRPPVPREPVYRAPPAGQPPPAAQPPPAVAAPGARSNICADLERRLVQEGQTGNQAREQLPRLETELRQTERQAAQAQQQLERSDCYEYFLFSKTLRNNRQCRDLSAQAETAKRRVAELDAQRRQIMGSAGRSLQDDIIRELARNNCGAAYQAEARKREGSSGPFGSVWQDEEGGGPASGGNYANLPFATYRTLCVRLCDGYYFPISFSTLPNHFQRDADACQSKCAAPAELYYHQNPGGAVEQMTAMRTQEPYTQLKTAFRYRKEYVAGCSCKQAEYVPQTPMPGQPAAAQSGAAGAPARDGWRTEARQEP
jgi:hypothetical protein